MTEVDGVERLSVQEIVPRTHTADILAHARHQQDERGLHDYFIVDVDSHHSEGASWLEILDYVEDPVLRHNSKWITKERGVQGYMNASPNMNVQDMHGRIPHQTKLAEEVDDTSVHRDVVLVRRAMEALGVDVQVLFPVAMLAMGFHPLPDVEVQLAIAYNRWFIDHVLREDDRIKGFLYLPLNDPKASLEMVQRFAGSPGVIGFMATSLRYNGVHENDYMPLYAELEACGLPLAFHAGPTWDDQWMRTTNRFLSMHALSFSWCNIVHMTNWVINGLGERFPDLNVIWIESGLAWLPFLMQRLDHEYLMRRADAPLLKKLPSDYMRSMYYTSQPLERNNMALLEATFTAISAETQLLYASDWPHWDFDLPSSITDLPFLSEDAKRNILGETARKLFHL